MIREGEGWTLMLGDSVERVREIEPETVGLSVFSPPLIGSHRIRLRAVPLESAMPTIRQIGGPVEKVEPKSGAELRADRERMRDQAALVTRCAFCDWTFDGTAGEGRQASLEHRAVEHPAATQLKARRRMVGIPKHLRTAEENERAALHRVEANRIRQEREDADRLAKIEAGRLARGEAA